MTDRPDELKHIEVSANRLAAIINRTGEGQSEECLTVGKMNYKSGEMSFLCRWGDERRWFQIMNLFLAKERGWTSHIAKKYWAQGGDVVAGWYLGFGADDIVAAAERIGGLLLQVMAEVDGTLPAGIPDTPPVADYSVDELPLVGPGRRNIPTHKDGKGAKGLHEGGGRRR